MRLAPETSKHCNVAVTGENMTGCYRYLKGLYGPAEIPTTFQEKIDRTLGHQTPVWLDDIIIVTCGTKEEHTRKLYLVFSKLENEEYRASKKKSKFYQKETIWHYTQYHKTASDQTRKNRRNQQIEPPQTSKLLYPFSVPYNISESSYPTFPKKQTT